MKKGIDSFILLVSQNKNLTTTLRLQLQTTTKSLHFSHQFSGFENYTTRGEGFFAIIQANRMKKGVELGMSMWDCCVGCFTDFTPVHRKALQVCLVVAFSGAFGGVAGGMYRRLRKCNPKPDVKCDYICFMIFGAVSAFAVMVICKWMGLVYENPDMLSRALYIVGTSVLGGFFAMRILPHLGDFIDDKFRQLSREMQLNREQIEQNMHKINDDADYARVVGRAEIALATKTGMDYAEAIACIEDVLPRFAHRRTINIYYGRLLRRSGRLNDAIEALKKFVKSLQEHKKRSRLLLSDKSAIAAAYFNIACYYKIQLTKDFQPKEILENTRRYLKLAVENNASYKNTWKDDLDLKDLASKFPKFIDE